MEYQNRKENIHSISPQEWFWKKYDFGVEKQSHTSIYSPKPTSRVLSPLGVFPPRPKLQFSAKWCQDLIFPVAVEEGETEGVNLADLKRFPSVTEILSKGRFLLLLFFLQMVRIGESFHILGRPKESVYLRHFPASESAPIWL